MILVLIEKLHQDDWFFYPPAVSNCGRFYLVLLLSRVGLVIMSTTTAFLHVNIENSYKHNYNYATFFPTIKTPFFSNKSKNDWLRLNQFILTF